MKIGKKILNVLIVVIFALFIYGFTSKKTPQKIAFNLLKKSLAFNEEITALNEEEVNNITSFENIFYLDDEGIIDFFNKNVKYNNKKHIVFRVTKQNITLKNNNSLDNNYIKHGIKNSKKYLTNKYNKNNNEKIIIKKIFDIEVKPFNKKKLSLVNPYENLHLQDDLYQIGQLHMPNSTYGGCGPVAEYIVLQYLISSNGLDNLLKRSIIENRNIDYLNKTYTESKLSKLKFADFVYSNTNVYNYKPDQTATTSGQLINGINKTLEGLGLKEIIQPYRTNIFQKRCKRVKERIKDGMPSLMWTYNMNHIYESNHWFAIYGYENWQIYNEETEESQYVTLYKICDNPSDTKGRYLNEADINGIWGTMEFYTKKHKFFYNSDFNLRSNYYNNKYVIKKMKNQFNETLDIKYKRAGFIQSYNEYYNKDFMFNTFSAGRYNQKDAYMTFISDSKNIQGISFNISKWGYYEEFDNSTDYVSILSGYDNEEIYRFKINDLYNTRYDLDKTPFYLKLDNKVSRITIKVYKNTLNDQANKGRIVINNLIIHE